MREGHSRRGARRGRWYTPEPWGQDVEADHAVLRALLTALRPWALQLQTDLPMAARAQWPAHVAAAADFLLAASPRHRDDTADYATTGWLSAEDDTVWTAYTVFAPYALGSDVLSQQAFGFIGIDDDGASVSVRLNDGQLAVVLPALNGRHLRRLN